MNSTTSLYPIPVSGRVKGEDFDLRITEIRIKARKRPGKLSTMTRRQFNKPPRVYVTPNGESLKEQFATRFDRPQRAYKFAAREAMAYVFGFVKGDYRITWSQRAGCKCGCAPGFVIRVNGKRVELAESDPRRTDKLTHVRVGLTDGVCARAAQKFGDPADAGMICAGRFDIFVTVEGADAEGIVTDRAIKRMRRLEADAPATREELEEILTDEEYDNLVDNEDMWHEHREPEWVTERNSLRGVFATGGRVIA